MPVKARGNHPLTWEELREQLDYDPETGWLTWKVSKPRIRKGQRAGYPHSNGHRDIEICGFQFREHRLIWWWMTGEDPGDKYVDHENRRPANNSWKNLRKATHGQNYVNSETFGSNRGINKKGENQYRVRITFEKKRYSKTVRTLLEAKQLRDKLEIELYGEFACTQR